MSLIKAEFTGKLKQWYSIFADRICHGSLMIMEKLDLKDFESKIIHNLFLFVV